MRTKRKLKQLWTIIVNFEFIIAIIVLATNIFLYVAGIKQFAVVSGSMEPTITVGSMVYVDTGIKGDDIKVGDIIAFNINDSVQVTHRVVGKDGINRNFTTKGDANDCIDLWKVPYSKMIGKTIFSIPYWGYISYSIKSGKWQSWILLVFLANLLLPMCFWEE